MSSFEVDTLHYIFESVGFIIGISYFIIFAIILQGILQQKKRTGGPSSKLAIMMAAIFISCGLSHFIHVMLLHTGFGGYDIFNTSNLNSNFYLIFI